MAKQTLLITSKEIEMLIKESLNKKLIIPHESFFNIFGTIKESVEENPLLEGIFRTYKPEKIVGWLKKRYGEAAIVNVVENDNGEKIFLIKTGDVDYNQKIIDNDMALCSYFASFVERRNGERTIQYEPLHQNFVNDVVQDNEYIFHITPTNKVNKILKIGLTPKTCNKKFVYPDRVYFFLQERYYNEWVDILEEFYNEQLKSYKMGVRKDKPYEGIYTVLAIDTEKVKNVDFSYDPNAEGCVYTYENIPPDAIEVVCEIKQEYLKK